MNYCDTLWENKSKVISPCFLDYFKLQFWPVVGWVNHQYVPLQFRVIFHSLVAFCWYACTHLISLQFHYLMSLHILITFYFSLISNSKVALHCFLSYFVFFPQGNISKSTSKIVGVDKDQVNFERKNANIACSDDWCSHSQFVIYL